MIAGEAEINPSCFSNSPLIWVPLMKEYLEIAEKYDNFYGNVKYMLTRMIPGKSFFYQVMAKTKTYDEIREKVDLLNENGTQKGDTPVANNERNDLKHKLTNEEDSNPVKKQQVESVA
jgi:tRNA-dihydrouridine synthase 2